VSGLRDVPTLVLVGERGAGKTTLIAQLLRERPPDERWAVLLNETGAAAMTPDEGIAVSTVDQGCICCIGQIALRVGLASLLRSAQPARLFIELAAQTHLGRALKMLSDPWMAPVVAIQGIVGVVDAARFSPEHPDTASLDAATVLCVRGAGAAFADWLARRQHPVRVLDAADATLVDLTAPRS
jgi:G3E family GTPase